MTNKKFVVLQFPNAPLIIAFVSWLTSRFTSGTYHTFSLFIFYVAGIIWAYGELVHGANWFRKLLGFVWIVMVIASLAIKLRP